MEQQNRPVPLLIDLGLAKELENADFRNQFFRTEREIDIPAQIKSLRKLRNLKQADLAERAGTQQSAVSRLECAQEAKWELETLVRLAEALDARLSVVIEPYENVISRYKNEEAESAPADFRIHGVALETYIAPPSTSGFRVSEKSAATATNRGLKDKVNA